MPKDSPISLPAPGEEMDWMLENGPQGLREAVQSVNRLLALQVRFIKAGTATLNQQESLVVADENIQLPLPILYKAGVPTDVATYTATAGAVYSQADMQTLMNKVRDLVASHNLILAGERSWQPP